MSKETIWKILREAEEHQMQSDRWADARDEELLKLRGLKLNEAQKDFIRSMDGYVAYELIDED